MDHDQSNVSKRKIKKVFLVRESIHTVRMKNDHNKSIYYLFIAIFILVLMDNISQEFLTNKTISLGLQTIGRGFGQLHVSFTVWILMHVPIIGLYYALQTWYRGLQKVKTSPALKGIWNLCCILCFAVMQLSLIYLSTKVCLAYSLPFGSATALLIETFRLMMKGHAFVRTNVPRLIAHQRFTSMSSYVYYLFAPTFIYQDSYPRTEKIKWKSAFICILEMIAIIFLLSFLYEGYIEPNYQAFDLEVFTAKEIAKRYFGMMLTSNLIYFGANYMVIHSWLNFTGEVMRFGDRLYYDDWWTSKDMKTYYRTWNITVHEWFYEFIYKDCCQYIFKGSEVGSTLMVFWLSAFMHEYVLVFSLRIFFPLLFIMFGGCGVLLYYITRLLPPGIGNVFFWVFLLLGSTFNISFYAMAYYSRKFSF